MRVINNGPMVHEIEQITIGSDGAVHVRMQRVFEGARIGDVLFFLLPDEAAPAFAKGAEFFPALALALVAAGKLRGTYAEV